MFEDQNRGLCVRNRTSPVESGGRLGHLVPAGPVLQGLLALRIYLIFSEPGAQETDSKLFQ